MLLSEAAAIADRAAKASSRQAALRILREMPLDDFGALLLAPETYQGLTRWLPAMAPEDVQQRWTGGVGPALLAQTLSFIRILESLHARFRRRALAARSILDYGCGWGRHLRLALYYSDPEQLFGVDAWDVSLEHCHKAQVPATLLKIDAAPERLPLSMPIDVAYSFSVFTHLPEVTARAVLRAIRTVMAPEGLLVFTFRPVEYWDIHPSFPFKSHSALRAEHATTGFAYQPNERPDAVYGDSSISHAALEAILRDCGWRRLAFDRALVDPYQEIVAAEPV